MAKTTKKPIKNRKVKWQTAVKRAMKKAANLEAADHAGRPNPNFRYRWEHVKTVVKLAKKLARETGADLEIVEAAAWLHDVKKFEARGKHPSAGAAFARELLPKTDFPPDKIEPVAQAIDQHMGLWLTKPLDNLEAAILWDADKLSKIGLTAAFHWIGGALSRENNAMSTKDMIDLGRRAEDWQDKTVASMHTAAARRAAAGRLQAYRALWDRLEMELKGHDLNS